MHPEAARLRDLSARWGSSPLLTQGAGGNTSLKLGSTFLIKASGKRLARASSEEIFLEMRLDPLREALSSEREFDFNEGLSGPLRGSIETPLHAVIPQRVVVHLHSVRALSFAVRANGAAELSERLSDFSWSWVPYAKPGWPLTWELKKTIPLRPNVWVLQNHGLIVAGETCDEVEKLLLAVETAIDTTPQAGTRSPSSVTMPDWRSATEPTIHYLAFDTQSQAIVSKGVICPDQAVFLGPRIPVVSSHRELAGVEPIYPAAIVKDEAVYVRAKSTPAAEDLLTCLALVSARLPTPAEVTYLTNAQVAELLDWDAEKHRQAMDAGSTG